MSNFTEKDLAKGKFWTCNNKQLGVPKVFIKNSIFKKAFF